MRNTRMWALALTVVLAACGKDSNMTGPTKIVEIPPAPTISNLIVTPPQDGMLNASWVANGGVKPYRGFAILVGTDTVWAGMDAPASADVKRFQSGQYTVKVVGLDGANTPFATASSDIMIQNAPAEPETALLTMPNTTGKQTPTFWLLSGDADWKRNADASNLGLSVAHGVYPNDPPLNGNEYQSFANPGSGGIGFYLDPALYTAKTADVVTLSASATFSGNAWDGGLASLSLYFQKVEGGRFTDRAGSITLQQMATLGGSFSGFTSLNVTTSTGAVIVPTLYFPVKTCHGGGVSTVVLHIEIRHTAVGTNNFVFTSPPVSITCGK